MHGSSIQHLRPEFLLVKLLHEQVHLATVCKEAVLNTSLEDGGNVPCAETESATGTLHSLPHRCRGPCEEPRPWACQGACALRWELTSLHSLINE